MAHFAQLDENNFVLQVIVVHDNELKDDNGIESEEKGIAFCQSLFPGTAWKQTSYNSKIRKNYAGIGHYYDAERDAFISPKPYPSWILNEEFCRWDPPVPKPNDGQFYQWDEETLSWR